MQINKYTLVNEQKAERALNGVPRGDQTIIGGVANGAYLEEGIWKREGTELTEDEIVVLEHAILAEYDKIGGLIRKGNDRVKIGSFYDFKGRKPFKTPVITFTYRVNGQNVDVPEGVELPGEVKAVKILEEAKARQAEEEDEEVVKKPKRVRRS